MQNRWSIRSAAFAAVLVIAGVPASADVLYSNGAYNGISTTPPTISYANAVSDTFVLSSNSFVTDANFTSWNFNASGVFIETVDWKILNQASGPFGSSLYEGTAAVTGTPTGTVNGFGFAIVQNSFNIDPIGLGLGAGTYWLELTNTVACHINNNTTTCPNPVDPVYWDQNNGTSIAWDFFDGNNSTTQIGSETFDILGTVDTSDTGTEDTPVPEPGSLSMFAALLGLLGLAYARRAMPGVRRARPVARNR